MIGRNLPGRTIHVGKKDGGIEVVHRVGSLILKGSIEVPKRYYKGTKNQGFKQRSTNPDHPRMNKPRSGGGAAAALWGVLFSEPA